MLLSDLITYVRRDIGDPPQTLMTNVTGDGTTAWFNLPVMNINPAGVVVQTLVNNVITTLASPANYTMDYPNGTITLSSPLPNNAQMLVTGNYWLIFSDAELTTICMDSVRQHTMSSTMTERYQGAQGFITYRDTPKGLGNLPRIEEPLVTQLSIINVLWVLATDTSTDSDIQTAEGTDVSRAQRYSQIMQQIEALTDRYEKWCGELNVGAFRMETLNLRRVSKWTGRLVPLFRDREYDDHRYPIRQVPAIDSRDEDRSGIPSPLWQSQGP